MHDALADAFEDRLAAVEGGFVAADHEGKRAGLRADGAAGDGCIERQHLGGGGHFVRAARGIHIDCRTVDDERAGARGLQQIAAPDLDDVRASRQHGDDAIDILGGLRHRGRLGDTALDPAFEIDGHDVEALHLVTGLHEVAGHRQSHVAEPDESDLGHAFLLSCV